MGLPNLVGSDTPPKKQINNYLLEYGAFFAAPVAVGLAAACYALKYAKRGKTDVSLIF